MPFIYSVLYDILEKHIYEIVVESETYNSSIRDMCVDDDRELGFLRSYIVSIYMTIIVYYVRTAVDCFDDNAFRQNFVFFCLLIASHTAVFILKTQNIT